MIHFEHISVVGVGLIGGSFALAARRAGLCDRITGWDGGRSLDAALAAGVIDEIETSFDEGRVCEADLVYLAAPIEGILDFINHRGQLLKRGAIVTDAGSAKREICQAARQFLPEGVGFVGGHPMAGSHKRGVEFASAGLFIDAPYVIITSENSQDAEQYQAEAVKKIFETVCAIGARPVMMVDDKHDHVVARVSHAPQIVSTALALAVTNHAEEESLAIAGSGLVDMTRLAQSEWGVWEGICKSNVSELTGALDEILTAVASLRDAMRAGEWEKLQSAFRTAKRFSETLEQRKADKS
jgi:prephenate dehydrogenase